MQITYDDIQKEAVKFALEYRKDHNLPSLPSKTELEKFKLILDAKYSKVIKLIRGHLKYKDSWVGHDYEHLEFVSSLAGFISEKECIEKNISKIQSKQVLETTLLSGLFHDIDRDLGIGEAHMIEGERTTKRLLMEAGVKNQLVSVVVRNHDNFDFKPGNNDELAMSYGSVFDADHFRWGLEREDTFWEMKKMKGKPVEDVIHDYQFLYPLRDAWKTNYGKMVGPLFIDFGLAIARHVEDKFSKCY